MAELRRLRNLQNAERERLRQEVCSQYPGGPDGYRIVPARCVRLQGTSRRQSRISRVTRTSSNVVSRQKQKLLERITELIAIDSAETSQRHSRNELPGEPSVMHVEVLKALYELCAELPKLLVATSKKLMAPHLVQRIPDLDSRYDYIATGFVHGEAFINTPGARLAAYRIALQQLG